MASLYARLGRNTVYLVVGTGAAALFNMGALAFNARALSPGEFGLLVLLQAATVALNGLMSFSPQQPVIQLGAAALRSGDQSALNRIVGLGVALDIVAAVAACTLGMIIVFLGNDLIGIPPERREAGGIFAASLLFSGYRTSDGLFRLFNRFDLLSFIQAGTAGCIFTAASLFWFIEASFAAYAWAWALFLALSSQLQLWTALYLLRRNGGSPTFAFRTMPAADVRAFLNYCWSNWGTSSVETVRAQGDSLLIGALVTVEAAGIYNVAKQVAGILRKSTAIYSSAVFPEVAALAAAENLEAARNLRNRMILISSVLGAVVVTAAALVGRPVLEFGFGERFAAAHWALVILMAAAAAQLISHTYALYVQVFVSPARLFLIYLLATFIFAIVAPSLTLWLSIEGTALAQVAFALSLTFMGAFTLGQSARFSKTGGNRRVPEGTA